MVDTDPAEVIESSAGQSLVRNVAIHKAFTLIELLVVITIIVVLLALLTPALDKAIYQAELAVCAANLHAIGRGATTYAMGAKRQYPYRDGVRRFDNWAPVMLTDGGNPGRPFARNNTLDDRMILEEFVSPKNYNDPLAPQDVDFSRGGTHNDTSVFLSINLWFGFQYRDNGNTNPGNFKLGDRVVWTGEDVVKVDGVKKYKLDLLVSDHDNVGFESGAVIDGHPDSDGITYPWVVENTAENSDLTPVTAAVKMTRSVWIVATTHERGTLDENVVRTDGSAVRYEEVTHDDGRMVTLPATTGGNDLRNFSPIR